MRKQYAFRTTRFVSHPVILLLLFPLLSRYSKQSGAEYPKTSSEKEPTGIKKGVSGEEYLQRLQGVYRQAKPDTCQIDFMMGPSQVFYRISEKMNLSISGNRYCDTSIIITTGARLPLPGRKSVHISCGIIRAVADTLCFMGEPGKNDLVSKKYSYRLVGDILRVKPDKGGFLANPDTYQEHVYQKQD